MPSPYRSRTSRYVVLGALFFLITLGALGLLTAMPLEVFYLYASASALTFIIYAIDKSAAIKGRNRTPENTLHLLAFMGGWPGALLAQQRLRHKTTKQPFRTIFWLTVMLNCAVLAWTFSPAGHDRIQSMTERLS